MSTLFMWHNRFRENEIEAVRCIYNEIEIPRPKSHDIEFQDEKTTAS